jgi:TRAP-type C4-dicarboxylate transport system permease large subunit
VPLTDVIQEIWPFVGALILMLFVITFFPALITWLPSVLKT